MKEDHDAVKVETSETVEVSPCANSNSTSAETEWELIWKKIKSELEPRYDKNPEISAGDGVMFDDIGLAETEVLPVDQKKDPAAPSNGEAADGDKDGKMVVGNAEEDELNFFTMPTLNTFSTETASMHHGRRVSLYPLTEEEIFNNVILAEYLQSHECCDYRLRFIRPPDNIPNATPAKGMLELQFLSKTSAAVAAERFKTIRADLKVDTVSNEAKIRSIVADWSGEIKEEEARQHMLRTLLVKNLDNSSTQAQVRELFPTSEDVHIVYSKLTTAAAKTAYAYIAYADLAEAERVAKKYATRRPVLNKHTLNIYQYRPPVQKPAGLLTLNERLLVLKHGDRSMDCMAQLRSGNAVKFKDQNVESYEKKLKLCLDLLQKDNEARRKVNLPVPSLSELESMATLPKVDSVYTQRTLDKFGIIRMERAGEKSSKKPKAVAAVPSLFAKRGSSMSASANTRGMFAMRGIRPVRPMALGFNRGPRLMHPALRALRGMLGARRVGGNVPRGRLGLSGLQRGSSGVTGWPANDAGYGGGWGQEPEEEQEEVGGQEEETGYEYVGEDGYEYQEEGGYEYEEGGEEEGDWGEDWGADMGGGQDEIAGMYSALGLQPMSTFEQQQQQMHARQRAMLSMLGARRAMLLRGGRGGGAVAGVGRGVTRGPIVRGGRGVGRGMFGPQSGGGIFPHSRGISGTRIRMIPPGSASLLSRGYGNPLKRGASMPLRPGSAKFARRYCRLVLHYPYLILVGVLTLGAGCIAIILIFGQMPDFSDPKLGFESRGTVISDRIRTFNFLMEQTVNDPSLLNISPASEEHGISSTLGISQTRSHTYERSDEDEDDEDEDEDEMLSTSTDELRSSENFFCDSPRGDYARLVFAISGHATDANLFTAEMLRSMCNIENSQVRAVAEFETSCITDTRFKRRNHGSQQQCCRSWSLGNYIASLHNRSSCADIEESDVESTLSLISECARYLDLKQAAVIGSFTRCWNNQDEDEREMGGDCEHIPRHCRQRASMLHDMLYYLADSSFVETVAGSDVIGRVDKVVIGRLTYAVSFLPIAAGATSTKYLFYAIDSSTLSDGLTRIAAMNFGIKQEVFDSYLLSNTVWFIVALFCVLVAMRLYTASLCITAAAAFVVFLSVVIAYIIYTFIFGINFFPFMNLLVIVILIGISVDDAFVYHRIWCLARSRPNTMTPEHVIAYALRRALVSMFATSATTATAFYAGYVSDVVILKCFALFAGTAVATSFLLTLAIIPAAVVIHEKWCGGGGVFMGGTVSACTSKHSKEQCCAYGEITGNRGTTSCSSHLSNCRTTISSFYLQAFQCLGLACAHTLPRLVVRLRYPSIVAFVLLGVAGIVIIFVYPCLKLPTSSEFQLFTRSHPFEVYDIYVKHRLRFEHSGSSVSNSETEDNAFAPTFPLFFVWGVKATDDGGHRLDPHAKLKTLEYDINFDPLTPTAQQFLLSFCRRVRALKYYKVAAPGDLQLGRCFIENFRSFMRRRCQDIDGQSLRPCCEISTFPYAPDVFNTCLRIYLPDLARSARKYLGQSADVGGVRFCKRTGQIISVVVEFESTLRFTTAYAPVGELYTYMNNWTISQLSSSAPTEMSGGWFTSELHFYDLQRAVTVGTPTAVALAIGIAGVVAFLTTLDIIVMIGSLVTISGAVSVTIAILVLIGWELNVVESVTMSVAVGLSVDYAMHYGAAYRTNAQHSSLPPPSSPCSSCAEGHCRVVGAAREIGSVVAMSAVTTLIVGLCLLPSSVLAYRQLGLFLIVVVVVSYLYATFFFQAVLCLNGLCRRYLSWSDCDLVSRYVSNSHRKHIDKTIYTTTTSKSTASVFSANRATNSSEISVNRPTNSSETVELQDVDHEELEGLIAKNTDTGSSVLDSCNNNYSGGENSTNRTVRLNLETHKALVHKQQSVTTRTDLGDMYQLPTIVTESENISATARCHATVPFNLTEVLPVINANNSHPTDEPETAC